MEPYAWMYFLYPQESSSQFLQKYHGKRNRISCPRRTWSPTWLKTCCVEYQGWEMLILQHIALPTVVWLNGGCSRCHQWDGGINTVCGQRKEVAKFPGTKHKHLNDCLILGGFANIFLSCSRWRNGFGVVFAILGVQSEKQFWDPPIFTHVLRYGCWRSGWEWAGTTKAPKCARGLSVFVSLWAGSRMPGRRRVSWDHVPPQPELVFQHLVPQERLSWAQLPHPGLDLLFSSLGDDTCQSDKSHLLLHTGGGTARASAQPCTPYRTCRFLSFRQAVTKALWLIQIYIFFLQSKNCSQMYGTKGFAVFKFLKQ